ncbi:UNVERIFIED_CONTAM: hypothetical protein K2H54_013644 [Gekko kuhli]
MLFHIEAEQTDSRRKAANKTKPKDPSVHLASRGETVPEEKRESLDFLEQLDSLDLQGQRELMVNQDPRDVKVMLELPVCREKEERRDPEGTRENQDLMVFLESPVWMGYRASKGAQDNLDSWEAQDQRVKWDLRENLAQQ